MLVKGKEIIHSIVFINYVTDVKTSCISEITCDNLAFEEKNIEKLKKSIAYRSALYYDALKNVH